MYSIEIKAQDKMFKVSASGSVTAQEGRNLLNELSEKASSINNISEYSLVLDTQELKPSAQDSLEDMNKVMQFYLTTPFKARFCIFSKSLISKMQIDRVGKEHNLNDLIQPVESYEEALKLSK